MIIKKFRILSLFMCVVLFMQVGNSITVKADSNNSELVIIDKKVNNVGITTLEICRNNNVTYYYEKEENDVISFTLINGTVNYAINDGLYIYFGDLKTNFDDLNLIKKQILLMKSQTDKVSLSKYYTINNETELVTYDTDSFLITNELNKLEYSEYAMKQIKTKTTSVTAYLYGGTSYGISKIGTWHIVAGTAISFIVALLEIPANTVTSILSFIIATDGVLHLIHDSDVTKYNAVVNRIKLVKVRDTYPYNTYSNVVYTAWITNIKECSLNYEYTNECLDYFDDDSILLKGLSNARF